MCVLDGSSTLQDWLVWDKHPIRKQYDVVMDLGELQPSALLAATPALHVFPHRSKMSRQGDGCPSVLL